jgi:hypothetical protein
MIHFHGTPLTPRAELAKLAGKHFCVSFARPDDAAWCQAHGQSVLWDSGTFSAHTRGGSVDWDRYYSWLEPRLGHPHFAVVPDVIDGDVDEQRQLLDQWPFSRSLGAPVWHMALPFDYLVELAENWPRICFGSSGRYWQVGSPEWARRADQAFNELERRSLRPWVHMLRGLMLCGDRWPFASADSTNTARNFKDYAICPERMARRIDAVQNPLRWQLVEQKELFA